MFFSKEYMMKYHKATPDSTCYVAQIFSC